MARQSTTTNGGFVQIVGALLNLRLRRMPAEAPFDSLLVLRPFFTEINPTILSSTARPKNILDNVAFVYEPIDENLLTEILDLLRPIHNFNYTRGRHEYRDPILGS